VTVKIGPCMTRGQERIHTGQRVQSTPVANPPYRHPSRARGGEESEGAGRCAPSPAPPHPSLVPAGALSADPLPALCSLTGVGPQTQFVLWKGVVGRSHIERLWSTMWV